MGQHSSLLKRNVWITAAILMATALLWSAFLHLQPLRLRGDRMVEVLNSAQSVTVREFRDYFGAKNYQELLTERSLSASQVKQLSSVFSDHSWVTDSGKACLFAPHHQIECRMPNGSSHIIHLCFTCGDIALDDGPAYDMRGWEQDIRKLLETAGVPIREDYYRYNPAN